MHQEASLAGAAAQPQSSVAELQLPGNPIPDPHLHAELQADALLPVEDDQPNGFVELKLAEPLVQACLDLGYTQPTVVQSQAIPLALNEGSSSFIDLMVSSQTGSGKTAAFLLPVLHTLLEQREAAEEEERIEWQRKLDEAAANGEPTPKRPRRKNPTDRRHFKAAEPGALVLCPTRELAQQVAHDAIDLVKHCKGLRIAHVVGGMPYAIQIARLQNADLVVATPGRLLDLQRSMQIKLEKVQFLVVDEADRMLDLGFAEDLAEIHALTAERRQTMMFSATFAPRIQQLATRVMREPQKIQIDTPQQKHSQIEQKLYWADNFAHKRAMLDHWLRDPAIEQAIVFASTQIECDGLAEDLQQAGFAAVALHGALSQGLRNRRLQALRQGKIQFLVATDVAARGIDVPSITHVFNFGLPMKAEDYTHRIGRTGRAGRSGIAVSFAEFRDRFRIWDIEEFTQQPLMTAVIPGMEPEQRAPTRHPPKGKGRAGGPGHGGRGGKRSFGGGRERGGFGQDNRFGGGDHGGFRQERGGFGGEREFAQDRQERGFQQRDRGFGNDRGFQQDRGDRGFQQRERGFGQGQERGFGGGFGDAPARKPRPATAGHAGGRRGGDTATREGRPAHGEWRKPAGGPRRGNGGGNRY